MVNASTAVIFTGVWSYAEVSFVQYGHRIVVVIVVGITPPISFLPSMISFVCPRRLSIASVHGRRIATRTASSQLSPVHFRIVIATFMPLVIAIAVTVAMVLVAGMGTLARFS